MRCDFLFGIGLLASVGAGAGSAVAADMPVRPLPPAAGTLIAFSTVFIVKQTFSVL